MAENIDVDWLADVAEWQERFFNYQPAIFGYMSNKLMNTAVDQFLAENPNCPFDRKWLLNEFYRML